MSSRWKKVWADFWSNKSRTFLTILTIAVGTFAVGFNANLGSYMLEKRAWTMGANSGGDSSDLLLLHSHRFSPSLVGALQCLQRQEALALFETEDLGILAEREALFWYLAGRMAPFYTLEVEGIISGFISYLELNREHILKTGFPSHSFEASPPLRKLTCTSLLRKETNFSPRTRILGVSKSIPLDRLRYL